MCFLLVTLYLEQSSVFPAGYPDQCKEIEENNRMRKIRDLFKKIGNTKRTFHARMVMKKDRKSKHLTETEDIKERWQEYTEELHKKVLMT